MTRPPARAPTGGGHEGETWGDFHLGRLLGRGGMGAVYAGRQMSLDRPVAIKTLIGHLAENEDFRKRFLLEARAAARINSPHVVQVYFAGTHGDNDFFAMEYVEGQDLARKLKDGWRPTPPECLALIIQATRSLVALGEHKIVHRDIKPANYMLTTAGVVKLMDFGLVKFASEAHGLTQTGTVMGTVNYFSPEQGRGEPCDQRTDLYALGVMFYEMLTGKLPFTGGDATSVIYQHIHAEPKPPKVHNPNVTEPYQSVVLKCLEKDPKDRYQTAKDLLDDLERIARGEAPLAGKGTAGGLLTGQPAVRKLTLAAAVIIAAVILGLAILLRPGGTTATVVTDASTTPAAVPPTTAPQPTPAPTPAATTPTPAVPPAAAVVAPQPSAAVAPPPVIVTPPAKPVEAASPPVVVVPPATPVVAEVPKPSVIESQARPVESVAKPVEPPPAKPLEPPVVVAAVTPPVEAPAKPIPPPVIAVVEKPAPAKPVVETPAVAPTKPAIPPTPPPAKPTAPTPLSTPVQGSLKIAIPAGDALLKSSLWLWWLEGPVGRSGRLSARSTRTPEITWTAPALPTDVTLHVAAVGSERQLTLPLKATPASGAAGTLAPFLRAAFADERHIQRLRRDADGSWWLVDVDGAFISRNADGWLLGGRFQPTPPSPRPIAVATTPTQVAVLDSDQPSLFIHGRDSAAARIVTGLQRPSDVVALGDGTWAVADLRAGGVLVFDAQGARIRTHVRSGSGGWDLLTRLASDGRLLYALDSGTPAIVVFGGEPQPLATWQLDRGDKPVALAALNANGDTRVYVLGVPSDIATDGTGDVYVAYPEREALVRHAADGKQIAIRHARTWTWKAYAADGANRLYAIDSERRRVVVLDAEGWRLGSFGKAVRQGGSFEAPLALAVQPDGLALSVIDENTRQVTRFDTATGTSLVFGGSGKGDGQFDTPVSVAMDQDGRTYVLDVGLHRVSVFDARGGFVRYFGRYERGDAPDMLRTPRLVTTSLDGGTVFVYDEDTSLIKAFAFDHATNQVRHLGNFGGRGTGPGQFTRIMSMGCDRRGRLYCLDYKRGDLQVFDVSGQSPTLVTTLRGDQAGIRKMLTMALNPDGTPYVIGGDQFTGLHWTP